MDRETRKKIRKQKALQFANDLKQGLTLQDVGDKYGYSREYIRQVLLNELGIKSNRKDYKFRDMGIKDEAVKCLVEEYNEKLQKLKAEKNKLYTEFANMRNYYHKKYGARYRTLKGARIMNNYEKIKSMTIDEMAEMFTFFKRCLDCIDYDSFPINYNNRNNIEHTKQWLEKECK